MNAEFVHTLKRRCIACLRDGEGTPLWLLRAGAYWIAFCPKCDGLDTGDTVMSTGELPDNDTGAIGAGGASTCA